MAATRALARLAWRDILRNRWRSGLVAAMVALPIFGLTAGGALVASAAPTAEQLITGHMGTADLVVHSWPEELTAADVAAALPDGEWTVRQRWDVTPVVGGEHHYIAIEDVSPADPVLGPMFELREGRAPSEPAEVAVAPSVLDGTGAAIGDTIALGDDGAEFRIVGTVVKPEFLRHPVGIVAPGTLDGGPGTFLAGLYVDFPNSTPQLEIDEAVAAGPIHGFEYRRDFPLGEPTGAAVFLLPFGLAALVLAETGLVAAAAFVVGARRKLRAIGILGANGGEPKHARRLLLLNGVLLGLVGSAAGVASGLAAAWAFSPYLDPLAGRVTTGLRVPLLLPAGAIVLGTVAAAVAAYGPARSAAKVATVEALAGRSPRPKPAGTLAIWGLATAGVGVAVIAWGALHRNYYGLVAGPVALIGGILVLIPFLVGVLGRHSRHLPLAARVAARETARHGRRTGAAVAAASVALMLPIAVATSAFSEVHRQRNVPSLADDQLIVQMHSTDPDGSAAEGLVDHLIGDVLPGAVAAPAAVAVYGEPYRAELEAMGVTDAHHAYVLGRTQVLEDGSTVQPAELVYVGDAALLDALHAGDYAEELAAGTAVVLVEDVLDGGFVRLEDPTVDPLTGVHSVSVPAVNASPGLLGSGYVPGLVVSAERAAELGLEAAIPQQWVIRAPADLTADQIELAREAAAGLPGIVVQTRADTLYVLGALPWVTLGATSLVALGIIAVAVALVSAESRRSGAILAAVGAGPRTQRAVAGHRALQLTLLAGVLAVPAGVLLVSAIERASRDGYTVVVPWVPIGFVLVVLPLVAGVLSAAMSRRPQPARMLRPIQ